MLTKKCLQCGTLIIKPLNCSLASWYGGEGTRRPNGVQFCSRKCSYEFKKGKHCSSRTEFKKGHKSWLKGTKGLVKSNKGSFKKGNKLSEETKAKMKGRIPWNQSSSP